MVAAPAKHQKANGLCPAKPRSSHFVIPHLYPVDRTIAGLGLYKFYDNCSTLVGSSSVTKIGYECHDLILKHEAGRGSEVHAGIF